jgi:all-trans-retinol 13,14-reductase
VRHPRGAHLSDHDAIVIGSGAGGLAAAVALARQGQRVMVFEQHYLPGGWCHSFPLGGHMFSPGVHYIGALRPGGMMRQVYEGLGVANELEFLELNPEGFDHILVGDEQFDIPRGKDKLAERLKARFPRDAAGIDRYLDLCQGMADELLGSLPAETPGALAALPWRLRTVLRHGLQPLERFVDGLVDDPVLKAVLCMQAGDHGVAPRRVPTVQHAAVVNHYFDGGFYPKGGARSLPRAFIKVLRRHGGQIATKTAVQEILVEGAGRSRKVVGVRLADGTTVSAPVVISNADAAVTYGKLLPAHHVSARIQRRLKRTRWSIGALSLFFGLDTDLRAKGLDSGNYWYTPTADPNRLYDVATNPDPAVLDEVPGVFLTVTTLKDPSKRKAGKAHTCEAFTFVDYGAFERWAHTTWGDRPEDYARMTAHLMDAMFSRLERILPDIKQHVSFAELGTPLTNEYFVASTRGNLYGTEKSLGNIGPFGFSLKGELDGLYLCGASTVGHGVAAATMSGIGVARQVLGVRRHELLDPTGQTLRLYNAEDPATWPERMQKKVAAAAFA